jgi:hypothetical protein
MKVGDLVVKIGWEHQGAGIVTKVWSNDGERKTAYATIQWADRKGANACDQLKVINESR